MSHRSDRSRLSSLSTIRPSPSPTSPIVSLLEPPTYIRHHYPGRPLPTPPIEVPPPSSSAYESLPLPRSATATRLALTLNVPSEMSDMMMTEKSTTTSSGLTYLADRPISPLSIASGSSIAEAINEADGETLGIEAKDLDLLISRIDSNDGGTYQVSAIRSHKPDPPCNTSYRNCPRFPKWLERLEVLARQGDTTALMILPTSRLLARSRSRGTGSSKTGE